MNNKCATCGHRCRSWLFWYKETICLYCNCTCILSILVYILSQLFTCVHKDFFSTWNSLNHFHHVLFFFSFFCSSSSSLLRADGGTRRGNMGHLTRIANMVVQNLEKGPVQAQITDLIKGDVSVSQPHTTLGSNSMRRQTIKVSMQITSSGGSLIALQRITYRRTSPCGLVLTVLWRFAMATLTYSSAPAFY